LSEKKASFTQIPNKILTLGLDAQAIAVFVALKSHGDRAGSNIFPGWLRLGSLTGLSRSSVFRALKRLRAANIILWDRGKKGIANNYQILGTGCWSKKNNGENPRKSVDKSKRVVSHRHYPSVPQTLPVVSNRHPNYIHLTRSNELGEIDFSNLVEAIKKKSEG
jgi:hypothetical protein